MKYKMTTLRDKLQPLDKDRRNKIEERTEKLGMNIMTYDNMNDRLKEILTEQRTIVMECKDDFPIPSHVNDKMQSLFDEWDELWEKMKSYG